MAACWRWRWRGVKRGGLAAWPAGERRGRRVFEGGGVEPRIYGADGASHRLNAWLEKRWRRRQIVVARTFSAALPFVHDIRTSSYLNFLYDFLKNISSFINVDFSPSPLFILLHLFAAIFYLLLYFFCTSFKYMVSMSMNVHEHGGHERRTNR